MPVSQKSYTLHRKKNKGHLFPLPYFRSFVEPSSSTTKMLWQIWSMAKACQVRVCRQGYKATALISVPLAHVCLLVWGLEPGSSIFLLSRWAFVGAFLYRGGETASVPLERWFSTIQTLGPFNTVPHAVETTNRKIISVILCNCSEHNRIFLDS